MNNAERVSKIVRVNLSPVKLEHIITERKIKRERERERGHRLVSGTNYR